MNRRLGVTAAFVAGICLFSAGCAVGPVSQQSAMKREVAAERDMLADAALAVETAPWPKPEQVSFVARLTGAADDDRVTQNDALETYLADLRPEGARFQQLAIDARANLAAANRLSHAAQNALTAPRLTMNDVAMIETAIQALRENRQIYVSAAHEIKKSGEPMDELQLDAIRDGYAAAIRDLGKAADDIADRIEEDRSATVAAPEPKYRRNFSGV